MEKYNIIMIAVWREVCQHIEITESLPQVANILMQHLPFSKLLIRRVDLAQSCIDTIAVGFSTSNDKRDYDYTLCTKEQLNVLRQWHQNGKILKQGQVKQIDKLIPLLVSTDNDREIIIGPLGKKHKCLPVLILISKPKQEFGAYHVKMIKALLEPLTIAIENDHRLKEMVKLRKALEADKKSLLVKLNRDEMGDTIIGPDTGLKNVMRRVELVANSDLPVLIFGATGTGKELISRIIHKKSNRSQGPFIRVNCGAIPPELIDSQLFGHERGSFTGAIETRKGWFEQADGGSLFLDEVGEMPLEAQVRLLRILQDGWMERIGGKRAIRVDVRIILATNCDLASMVSQGRFREDLWYRISTFPIFLPPLKDRLEDLPALAEHFAKRSAIRFGLPLQMPTKNDLKLLASYSWPGNIRELGTVIDRAALLGDGKGLQMVKAMGWSDSFEKYQEVQGTDESKSINIQEIKPLDEAMKQHIEATLMYTRGKIEGINGAASILKINPHTLRGRMRKLAINWLKYR